MIRRFHRIGRKGKVGKLPGIRILALVEEEAVFIVHIQFLVGVCKHFLSLRIQTGDGVAIHHEFFHAAQKIAVERRAVRICCIFFNSLLAIRLCHAHSQQHIRSRFRIVLAYQRSRSVDPQIPVFTLCHLREQFHISPADTRQIILRIHYLTCGSRRSHRGGNAGCRRRYACALLAAADSRQQADRRQGHCNKFLFHHHMKVPPVLK